MNHAHAAAASAFFNSLLGDVAEMASWRENYELVFVEFYTSELKDMAILGGVLKVCGEETAAGNIIDYYGDIVHILAVRGRGTQSQIENLQHLGASDYSKTVSAFSKDQLDCANAKEEYEETWFRWRVQSPASEEADDR